MIHRRQPGATHPGTRHTARSFLLVTGVMLFAALVVANTADSANKPPSLRGAANGRPDLDQRFEGQHVAPTAQQRAQLRKLGDVEIGWTALGTPHSLRARNGALTKPDRGEPDDIARGFLRENAELFRQKPQDIADLELWRNARVAGDLRVLRYRQTQGALPVHGTSMLVVLDTRGRIWSVGGLSHRAPGGRSHHRV